MPNFANLGSFIIIKLYTAMRRACQALAFCEFALAFCEFASSTCNEVYIAAKSVVPQLIYYVTHVISRDIKVT